MDILDLSTMVDPAVFEISVSLMSATCSHRSMTTDRQVLWLPDQEANVGHGGESIKS